VPHRIEEAAMVDTRRFPLADILSVTTPYLLSRRRMAGVCDLVDWMTYSKPTPDRIDLPTMSRLRLRTDMARTSLLRQHPQLAGVCPAAAMDKPDLMAWLIEQERVYGAELPVEQAVDELQAMVDALSQAFRPLADWVRDAVGTLAEAVQPMLRQLAELGAALEVGFQADEAALAAHPDIAELDARLGDL
jgi:hypothetical protein